MGEHTETGFKPTPAIVRSIDPDKDAPTTTRHRDANEKIISQPTDTVTHSRGFGDSGYRVQVVKHDCPECGFDRMVRRIDKRPELGDEVRYWCLHPNCVHYARDSLSHACRGNYPHRDTNTPAIFEEPE